LQAQEVIASLQKKRARDLSNTIRHLIENDALFADFYEHPLIKNIKIPADGFWDKVKRKLGRDVPEYEDPAYIPASTFATIIFDIVAKAGTPASPIQNTFSALRKEVGTLQAGNQKNANALLGHIADLGRAFSGSQTESLKAQLSAEIKARLAELGSISVNGATPLASLTAQLSEAISDGTGDFATIVKGAGPYLDQIRIGAAAAGSVALGDALHSLLAGVEDYATNADKAIAIGRKNVEAWFNTSMDRLSSWYKRWAQAWIFFIGLGLAVALNVDSVAIANHLWREPAVRQALAANAQKFVAENEELPQAEGTTLPNVVKDLREEFVALKLPVGWVTESKPKTGPNKDLCPHPEDFATYVKDAKQLYMPAGDRCVLFSSLPTTFGSWVAKILGIFLTAVATMQGAPLWFDLLKKLINVRNTGINPTEKPKPSNGDRED
jgi:hypothetical protein